ncbi:MAG: DUF3048 domain-containing protein [Anaerolineae bacterium]|nr:DUF3048 domain-containing protein [Anaerolineae bacterium]
MNTSRHTKPRWLLAAATLLAACSLLGALAGCDGSTAGPTPTPTRTPQAANTAAPTAVPSPLPPSPTPPPPATPTATPRPENVNPLTGEVVADPSVLQRVPVAIKISNWPGEYVRPQAGINSADIIHEHYNEGWFATRWTAIYLAHDPERVGPVRSGRLIDLEIPAIYRAVFACWGFSNGVLEIFLDSDLYPDQVVSNSIGGTLSPSPFFRDYTRDVPLEHTGYTSPAMVRAWADAHDCNEPQPLEGMVFGEQPPDGGEPATSIYIPWNRLDAEWRYDEASGRYLRWTDGLAHVDFLDSQQLNVANVVLLYVPQWNTDIVEDPHSGALSIQFALWYSNRAVIFRDGQRFEGFWQRWERQDMLTLTDEAGNPIPLKIGNTFFEVIPTGEQEIAVIVEP